MDTPARGLRELRRLYRAPRQLSYRLLRRLRRQRSETTPRQRPNGPDEQVAPRLWELRY